MTMNSKLTYMAGAAIVALLVASCGGKKKSYDELGDSGRTVRTENLEANLPRFVGKGVLIGQQYGTLRGIGWQGDSARSDFRSICNDRPAVNAYELCGIERGLKTNADSIPFSLISKDAVGFFRHGGLILMTWTAPNPNGNEQLLHGWVRKLAAYLGSLHDGYGIKAPVVLFPFPLSPGTWYARLSPQEYRRLYRQTVQWLRDEQVTNVLFGFSESFDGRPEHFGNRLPVDETQVINFTFVQPQAQANEAAYRRVMERMVPAVVQLAQEYNKVAGITTGIEGLPDSTYFSSTLLPLLQQNRLSYVLLGSNHGEYAQKHFFAPWPGADNSLIKSFMTLYNDPSTIFLSSLNGLYLKQTEN